MFRSLTSRRKKYLSITRNGVMFLLLIGIMAVVGMLKGLNLIYLIVSLMISFMFMSQLLTRIGLSRLSVDRTVPKNIFAEKPFPVELQLTNQKKRCSSYSLTVQDQMEGVSLPERYIITVPSGAKISVTYKHRLDRRGLYTYQGIEISTSYPLDFFVRGFVEPKSDNIIVYPKVVRLNPNFLAELMSDVEMRLNRPGAGQEVYGFRKYMPGDDSRDINWKLTAKTSEVMITKFSQDQNLNIVVVFDNAISGPESTETADNSEDDIQFESAVTFVASISSFFIEKGYKLKLVTQSGRTDFGDGAKHLFEILEHLALIQPVAEPAATKDVYHPAQLEQHLGILVTCEKKAKPTGHFFHTFYAHGIEKL